MINYDITNNISNYNYNYNSILELNPVTINIKNIINLEEHFYITEKADGIKTTLNYNNLYPGLDYFNVMEKFNISTIYCEKVKMNNINVHFIIGGYEFIQYLRTIHKYTNIKDTWGFIQMYIYNEEWYKKTEMDLLYGYINENKDKKKDLWWPKMIWETDKSYFIEHFDKIKNHKNKIFKTDGWVLITKNKLLKVKPDNELSIDLFYNNTFYYDKHIVFDRISNLLHIKLEKEKIYRCYYNEHLNIWFPKEIREDKKVANNKFIVNEITNYFKHKWSIKDVRWFMGESKYYQKKK